RSARAGRPPARRAAAATRRCARATPARRSAPPGAGAAASRSAWRPLCSWTNLVEGAREPLDIFLAVALGDRDEQRVFDGDAREDAPLRQFLDGARRVAAAH